MDRTVIGTLIDEILTSAPCGSNECGAERTSSKYMTENRRGGPEHESGPGEYPPSAPRADQNGSLDVLSKWRGPASGEGVLPLKASDLEFRCTPALAVDGSAKSPTSFNCIGGIPSDPHTRLKPAVENWFSRHATHKVATSVTATPPTAPSQSLGYTQKVDSPPAAAPRPGVGYAGTSAPALANAVPSAEISSSPASAHAAEQNDDPMTIVIPKPFSGWIRSISRFSTSS